MKTTKEFIEHFNNTITEEGRVLIIHFFISFSRFECALKNSNFLSKGKKDKAEADWDLFIASIRPLFDKCRTEELKIAVEYLITDPPKIQIVRNKQLAWENRGLGVNQPEINVLAQSIRDLRNNLFHGGKFNGIYQRDLSRNYKLLQSSIEILNDWINLDKTVMKNYLKELQ